MPGVVCKSATQVLYSGQSAMDPLLTGAASYSVGALVLLVVCKVLAYSASLGSFRRGPTFPAGGLRHGRRRAEYGDAPAAAVWFAGVCAQCCNEMRVPR